MAERDGCALLVGVVALAAAIVGGVVLWVNLAAWAAQWWPL